MDYQLILKEIYNKVHTFENVGNAADYIPELACIDPEQFGICIRTLEKEKFGIGDCDVKFSIQSIAKVLSLTMAYNLLGEKVWERVDVEPSGTPFNSLLQLEADAGIPRNPFINAGAIVVADMLVSELQNPKEEFLGYVRRLGNDPNIDYDIAVAESEKAVGYLNVALCNFLKSLGNIENDADEVLDFYFHICSLSMSCTELSGLFLFLANDGFNFYNREAVITRAQSKRINALMLTCGFYDESGEFAFRVGIPGKSGVGGGIVAVHPGHYAIAAWSPRLNEKGNSYRGMLFLEEFTTRSEFSIF